MSRLLGRPWHTLARLPVFGRLGIFWLILLLLWLPLAAMLILALGLNPATQLLAVLLLYSEFVWLIRVWSQRVYGRSRPLKHYGLELSRRNFQELLAGLGLGLMSLFGLFGLQGGLGWLVWQAPMSAFPGIALEGLVVALGIGWAEELLFRGWLLDELEQDYSQLRSQVLGSSLFALLHFLRPLEAILQTWPQFLGLLFLGWALVQARRVAQGRLGLAIGLHAGLVWGYYLIDVADLVRISGRVPAWITGVNQNPLAGLLGLLFLGGINLVLAKLRSSPSR